MNSGDNVLTLLYNGKVYLEQMQHPSIFSNMVYFTRSNVWYVDIISKNCYKITGNRGWIIKLTNKQYQFWKKHLNTTY